MQGKIVVDESAIRDALSMLNGSKNEIDNIVSELFYIRAETANYWSSEALEQFNTNMHSTRQKGMQAYQMLDRNIKNLSDATGILLEAEKKNKNVIKKLDIRNIF